MNRSFSQRQRRILSIVGGNSCAICGKNLKDGFHADHILPYSKKGKTILKNGQALCPKCNLKKGSK
tara:strand:- start:1729 stop:1926 length:198 start_codon:yes stop_codon:yes gene_type:complete